MSECDNCNKYDYQTHSCPIFCDVIRNTLDDVRADEKARMLEPYDVESIEELIQNVRAKVIDALMNEVAQIKGISDEDWNLLEQKTEQMKGDKE